MKETLNHQNATNYGLQMYHIAAGKLYLSPILDLHNREIVAFNISTSPNFEQTKDMLSKASNKYKKLEELTFILIKDGNSK